MKYINAEKLKETINKQLQENADKACLFGAAFAGRAAEDNDIINLIDSLQEEQPSLPSDSDEEAKEFAKTTFKKPYSDNPDEEVTIVEPDKYAGFIAGARHEDEQLSEKIAATYQLGLADKEKQMMSMAVEGWVAVDSDTYCKRRVTFFPQKPVRDVLTEYKYWAATRPRYESIELDSNAFPSLKWEDEPKKVKLIIIKED